MLSVPPDVTVPTTGRSASCARASAPPSISAAIDTTSASNFVALGHRSECSGFACEFSA